MRGNKLFKFLDYYIGIPLVFLLSLFLRGRRNIALSSLQPKKILVIKLVALGDSVLLVPSLRALRKKFPDADITFLGTSLTGVVVNQFPEYVNRSIAIDVVHLSKHPAYAFTLSKQLRDTGFDVVIDFEQWTRLTPLLIAFANIPVRVGFNTNGQYHHYLYTHAIVRTSQRHEADTLLSLVEQFTGKKEPHNLELRVDSEFVQEATQWLVQRGWMQEYPIIVLHPGCGTHGFPREWQPKNYRALIERITTRRRCFFILTGMKSEEPQLDAIGKPENVSVEKYFISSTNKFIALLSLANLVISGNTGAMHLAAGLGKPQIALHGPTNANIWGPINSNAIVLSSTCPGCPCLDLGFEYHRTDGYCMEQISVEEVFDASMRLLN